MSSWRYRGQCIGRVLHFLYHYVGFDAAEHARIGNGVVEYHGQKLATFAWSTRFGERDVPEFEFCGENAALYEANQAAKREAAILDALPSAPAPEARRPVHKDVLYAIDPAMAHSSGLHIGILEDTRPVYFISGRALWCKGKRRMLYWSRDLKDWLRGPEDDDQDSAP